MAGDGGEKYADRMKRLMEEEVERRNLRARRDSPSPGALPPPSQATLSAPSAPSSAPVQLGELAPADQSFVASVAEGVG